MNIMHKVPDALPKITDKDQMRVVAKKGGGRAIGRPKYLRRRRKLLMGAFTLFGLEFRRPND